LFKAQVKSLQKEVQMQKQQTECKARELQAAEARVEELEEAKLELDYQLRQLQQRDKGKAAEDAQGRAAQAQEELAAARTQIAQLEARYEDSQRQLGDSQQSLTSLRAQLSDLQQMQQQLEASQAVQSSRTTDTALPAVTTHESLVKDLEAQCADMHAEVVKMDQLKKECALAKREAKKASEKCDLTHLLLKEKERAFQVQLKQLSKERDHTCRYTCRSRSLLVYE